MIARLPHIGRLAALALCAAGLAPGAARAADDFATRAARAASAIETAAQAGVLWLHTREKLEAAKKAFAAGREARARELAADAEAEALLAVEQQRLESARYRLRRARELGKPLAPAAVQALEAALAHRDGRAAEAAAARLEAAP